MGLEAPTMIKLSDPQDLSMNFVRIDGAVSRDYDGYLTCTVLYTGIPVAYVTDKRSNYGDAVMEEKYGLVGSQHVITDDPTHQQVYAHFLEWIGGAAEGFAAKATDILSRPARVKEKEPGEVIGTVITPWTIWDAFDELDYLLDDGHAWCGFLDKVDCEMYRAFPDEWPVPNEWHGEPLS